jgi:1,4-dihydroxy-2-naphthoate octaprenyltransferase
MLRKWIEAMRLRTLPVSIAGVITGTALAIWQGGFSPAPALLCLVFAVTAQIASNFGNEYYDFKHGMDKKGRDGFRRGVTEGDISPKAMKTATFIMLGLAALTGCSLLFYGGWWLLPAGLCILIAALAYSAGPYPLSHHSLGEIAVVIFFGVVPVTLTYWLQVGQWMEVEIVLGASLAVGLMAANVLIVNNYRDMDDDKAVGKNTTVVRFGRKVMGTAYLMSGILAMALMIPVWMKLPVWALLLPAFYLIMHVSTWRKVINSSGSALNPLLGKTARNLLLFSLLLLVVLIFTNLICFLPLDSYLRS